MSFGFEDDLASDLASDLEAFLFLSLSLSGFFSCPPLPPFGSSADNETYNDIDLAIEGIESGLFFSFYGELFKNLSKPVDLVDLKHKTAFNKLIREIGLKIYG